MRTVLGILRQGVRHPLQCWIAHLGQLRGKLWLWLAKPWRFLGDGTVSPEKMQKK